MFQSPVLRCFVYCRTPPNHVGYVDIPQVELAVSVHLSPQNTATWWNHPRLPSKASHCVKNALGNAISEPRSENRRWMWRISMWLGIRPPQFIQYEEKPKELPRSKLDECFLHSKPPSLRQGLPFFPDLHTEVSRSWGKPFSACVHSSATLHYSNVVGAIEHGYGVMPRVEQMLVSYLSPGMASSLKAPTLPTKPLHTTSALAGKGYLSVGQAGACLHTIAVLQAYQVYLLKELDEDLFLRATKETVYVIGRSMAAMLAAERHLWLSLSHMKQRDILLDAPLTSYGLFGDSVNPVVDSFCSCWVGAATYEYLLLVSGCPKRARRGSRDLGGALMPSGDRTANPASHGASGRSGLRRAHLSASAWQRRGAERLTTSEEVLRMARSVVPCRSSALRRRSSRSGNTRDHLAAWKCLPNVSQWVLHTVERGYRIQFGSPPPLFFYKVLPTLVSPEQALVMEQEVNALLRKEAIKVEASCLQPRTLTPHFHEVYGCSSGSSATPGHPHTKLFRRLVDISSNRADGGSTSRCCSRSHERAWLRLNTKKSVLSPPQRTTYLGVVWDSSAMQARPSPARIESILTSVKRVKIGRSFTVKQFQKLLGLMADASNVIPFGLLYMRPLQWWPEYVSGVEWEWSVEWSGVITNRARSGFFKSWSAVVFTRSKSAPLPLHHEYKSCKRALDMWRKPWFLNQGPVLGAPCRRVTLATDASLTGWGAVMSGHPARGLWSGLHLTWHINRLEMLAVFQALKHFLPDLRDYQVLVRTDNTSVISYINHQGGLRSRPLYKMVHQILVWSQGKLLSLRAVYIPEHLNQGADVLLRQGPRPREWRLHPEVVELIWRVFGQAQVNLFATQETSQCPLGLDTMVQMCPNFHLYVFPPIALLPGESVPGRHLATVSSPVLARPSMVLGRDFPPRRLSMGDSCQEGSPLTSGWHDSASLPGVVEAVGVALRVVETILQSRAPSTRKLYTWKWRLFISWYGVRQLNPVHCLVGTVLEFLQAQFTAGLTHSTLKVYVSAIAAFHSPLGGQSVGKHPLVTRFLHGALRLRPPIRSRVPTWDLAVVLEALCKPSFESLEAVSDRTLTLKTVFLLAISSLKRVGDLQALSVAPSHLDFAPGMAKAFLYPRPGYIPKVPASVPQPIVLQAFCPPPFRDQKQQRLNLLCPRHSLS
ncbi:hypothetical protein M9458_051736 [Cirrhinus mrigala]|uniref:RNase H type-1 domain-containing protein n=1 Tax=Cirrhinus mrigala TaxID=683832 RepID=A0ABD0MXZ0_CIRMR